MQNLPKEGDLAKKIRMLFEAENGFTLVAFDYSQLELRLLAHLAEEENLIKAFEKDLDVHALTASKIIQKPIEKIEVKERRLGKTLNFGIIYGMGPRSFAEEAEIPLPEAKKFIEDYFQTFPKVKMWQESIKEKMIKNGFVENIYGRKRWFNTKTTNAKEIAENERAAINMPVQSLGADLLKKSMIKIYNQIKSQKELNKVKMLLTIHDELIFEIQNDILKEKIIEIKNIMENIEKLNVSLKVDVKIGPNLGNLENYVIH
jgi:DNA polymerase-1